MSRYNKIASLLESEYDGPVDARVADLLVDIFLMVDTADTLLSAAGRDGEAENVMLKMQVDSALEQVPIERDSAGSLKTEGASVAIRKLLGL